MNGDCFIDDGEFFGATDRWLAVSIDDGAFFSVLDAWIGQFSVCPVISSNGAVIGLHVTRGHVNFRAHLDAQSARVEIYDLSGQLIHKQRALGSRLSWNMRDARGARVANGVYLYKIEVVGSVGNRAISAWGKFVVLN